MGFGLAKKGRTFETGPVGLRAEDLPSLPDDVVGSPESGWLDARQWFPDAGRPLEIEIGSGKGTFLVQQAGLQAGTNFLGIEWAGEFWAYAADRVRRSGLTNVRLLHGDGGEFLHWRVASGSVRVVHLYFPDPWPKTRHHKRRMVSDRFLKDVERVLEVGGELRVVTDHEEYWAWMCEHFERWLRGGAAFEEIAFERPHSASEGEVVGTNFERKYRREGRPFHARAFRKRGSGGR